MDAEIAFFGEPGDRVEKSCIVRTSLDAIFASDTLSAVDDDDTVLFPLVGGSRRANINALRVATVIAEPGKIVPRDVGIITFFGIFNPGTGNPQRHVKFGLAGDAAGMASDTTAGIDEHAVLFCTAFFFFRRRARTRNNGGG